AAHDRAAILEHRPDVRAEGRIGGQRRAHEAGWITVAVAGRIAVAVTPVLVVEWDPGDPADDDRRVDVVVVALWRGWHLPAGDRRAAEDLLGEVRILEIAEADQWHAVAARAQDRRALGRGQHEQTRARGVAAGAGRTALVQGLLDGGRDRIVIAALADLLEPAAEHRAEQHGDGQGALQRRTALTKPVA